MRKTNQQKVSSDLTSLKTSCPKCGAVTKYGSHCKNCGNYIIIPSEPRKITHITAVLDKKQKKQHNQKLSSTQRNWIIGTIIIITFLIIGSLGNRNSTSNLYTINNTTFVALSKNGFDEMFRYIIDNDNQALTSFRLNGYVKTIYKGTDVYLISAHLSYSVVRLKGSNQNLWIASEFLTQK